MGDEALFKILSHSLINFPKNDIYVLLLPDLIFGTTSAVHFHHFSTHTIYMLYVAFVMSKTVLRHPKRDASKNVPTPTVLENYEILRAS